MLEELFSYMILLSSGFTTLDNYNKYLNHIFLQQSDNDLLLELQWHSSDLDKTIGIISEYVYGKKIKQDKFGKFLFEQLQLTYTKMTIDEFGKKAYTVWSKIPPEFDDVEPFWTLCYGDDPLSWGDEKQTRELYEKAFNFYKS